MEEFKTDRFAKLEKDQLLVASSSEINSPHSIAHQTIIFCCMMIERGKKSTFCCFLGLYNTFGRRETLTEAVGLVFRHKGLFFLSLHKKSPLSLKGKCVRLTGMII